MKSALWRRQLILFPTTTIACKAALDSKPGAQNVRRREDLIEPPLANWADRQMRRALFAGGPRSEAPVSADRSARTAGDRGIVGRGGRAEDGGQRPQAFRLQGFTRRKDAPPQIFPITCQRDAFRASRYRPAVVLCGGTKTLEDRRRMCTEDTRWSVAAANCFVTGNRAGTAVQMPVPARRSPGPPAALQWRFFRGFRPGDRGPCWRMIFFSGRQIRPNHQPAPTGRASNFQREGRRTSRSRPWPSMWPTIARAALLRSPNDQGSPRVRRARVSKADDTNRPYWPKMRGTRDRGGCGT